MNESENLGRSIADDVWARVVQLVQLAMLTGTDVIDHLRNIKVRLDADKNQHVLGDGQNETFQRYVDELTSKIPELESFNTHDDPKNN